MQVGGINCTSQRFALTRCRCSSQEKKPRQRKSKEERRGMVENFIINYRNTNKGSFPSLKLTHKEVGGSYYIVRDIVRDIIQENRVLGPGDLDMQSLTLEDVPVQPEICENANTNTGAELHHEAGSEEVYIVVESVNQGSNVSLESSEENEDQNLDLLNDRSFEQMEVLDYKKHDRNIIAEETCTGNVGKQPIVDVLESDFETGEVGKVSETDGPLPCNEAKKVDLFAEHPETSDSNGAIQESVMEVSKKTVMESKSDSEEVKGEVLEGDNILNVDLEMPGAITIGDLQEEPAGEMTTETVEKSYSEIKIDGQEQSLESNGKMSFNENKKSTSFMESVETSIPNGGFESLRTVVEVEQFPLPRANSSLNRETSDGVSASAVVEEREMELVEVKAPATVITETETKPELEDLSSGKSLDAVPKTEDGATVKNATKTKGWELNPKTPINEYLLHRHESYLKLDFLTRELSMDASSNRDGAKKTRVQAENNPLWNTLRAFVTAIIKFWSE
ncbi:DNA binding protein isoform X2 [Carex rostrata]